MKHRLYHPPPLETGQTLTLDRVGDHYLTRVLRLRRGEQLECFDGAGRAWVATLQAASPRSATLRVGALLADEPEPQPRLHLVQGLLKGGAMDLVVQKATELGATDLWPVLAERSNVPTAEARLARKFQHWQRIAESATEQCGGRHLPRLHPVTDLEAFLGGGPDAQLILLDPEAAILPPSLPRLDTCLLIGPEGGWSPRERDAVLAAGGRRHALGARILRGETAPLATLAAVRHGWGWR